ncbi:hypothetical protein PFISCL1PPCAC_22850, partial [Pristionchus fissidentatus]
VPVYYSISYTRAGGLLYSNQSIIYSEGAEHSSLHRLVEVLVDLGEDLVDCSLSLDPSQLSLLLIVGDHGRRGLVEGLQAQLDRVHVVVGAATGLGTLEQPLDERLLGHLEVDGQLCGHDLGLKLISLRDLSRVAVDEESLAALGNLLEHRLLDQIENDSLGNELAGLHDLCELRATGRARLDLIAQEISRREMGQAVLGDNLLALRALARAGTANDEEDGYVGLLEGSEVDGLIAG